ncbi:ricin-type beta-trefoil lectin domain protein [Kitasatospora sp. NPDC059577]|uniref:ricin-type beta-trefoil lectin domain protein n=1 Tax=Kitasatospora sp. NPDC059577 TaxID=3346873 RepID=UPI0036A9A851
MSSTPRAIAHTPPAPSIRRRLLALTSLGTGCALSLALLSAPAALATDTASTPPTHGPAGGVKFPAPTSPAPARTPAQQAMLDAIAKAKSTGKPVAVEALTNELSTTVANPNGTLTTTDNAQAVRTKRSGAWKDIDPTLRANGNGTLSPAVATTGLTFSGGGAGPMATVTTDDGKSLAVNAPFPLPKPTVAGANATYADVLPGVDLQLTALPQGGWRDVIIVRTKEAAESAALKSLTFPVSAQGLSIASDPSGALSVKDDKGATRFRAPAPLQWDSSKPASAPVAAARASRSEQRTVLAATAPASASPEGLVGIPSSAEEPGDGANVAAIGTRVTPSAIELTPNQDALGAGDGPWFLDPSFVAATSYAQGSVEVQENHKSAKNYNLKSNVATGYCGFHSSDPSLNCDIEGRQRAYFQFGINPANYTIPSGAASAPIILGATFNGQVTGASNMATDTPFVIYSGPPGKNIGADTNWYAQPCGDNGNVVMEGCAPINGQRLTGTGPLAIDVTDTMKRAATEKWQVWTVGIAPQTSEWDKNYRHYLANNPSITTTYDITPTVWWPRTTPTPGFASTNSTAECTSGGANPWDNPGWVGSNQEIYLTANSWSPTGQNLYTGYQLWDDNDPNFGVADGDWGGSYNAPGPSKSVGSLADGHQYGWVARADDTTLTSPNSAWCYFRVDKTNPRVSIGSTDFPPSGTPNPTPAKYVNDQGTFTINADDPAPGSGLQASGVACVRVSSDPTPVVGWKCGQDTLAPGQPYTYKPKDWGTNTLYACAMDNAGNYSQPAVYNFYVPWKPDTQPLFGDVDNDQRPDMVTVDKNGDLRVIGGTTDPTTSLAAPAVAAPNARDYGATWADYQISHHGTFVIGQSVDEVLVHYNKDTTSKLREALYLIPSDGSGRFDTLAPIALKRPACTTYDTGKPCLGYNRANWSNAAQVIAIGTPEGEAVGGEPGNTNHKVIMTQTSVLSLENNNLYLFQPNGLADALDAATYLPAASGSWADLELINPGAANGPTSIPGTTDPTNQATVWARNRTTGDVYAYPLGWKADGTVDYTALTKPDQGIKLNVGQALKASDYPRIGAGDLNNDGTPDLWAMDTTNSISIYPGKSSTGVRGKVDSFDAAAFAGYSDSSVTVHPQLVDWQCMDSIGGPNEGTDVAVYACWQTVNQRFNFAIDGTIRSGSWCVSTKGNALGNGTGVMLSRCVGNTGQKWAVRPDGRIYLPATVTADNPGGRCLELPGWHTEQGTRLGIWDCPAPQANQQWNLTYEKHKP